MRKRTYTTLQDWMERTGNTGDKLAALTGIKRSFLSKILTRSRRCSYENALKLSQATGVPVESLVRWMTSDDKSQSDTAA